MKENLLRGAIDMHVHASPDYQVRKYTEWQLQQLYGEAGMKGYISKCHANDTAGRAAVLMARKPPVTIYGALVLNHCAGGLNPAAVEASARLGGRVIWFPTVDAISILGPDGNLLPVVYDILKVIKKYDLILATGHIPASEARLLLKAGAACGIRKMIATHVSLPLTKADLALQQEYLSYGACLEHCFYTPFHHLCTLEEIADSIRQAGAEQIILSSDMGQPEGLTPPAALASFVSRLQALGISSETLRTILVDNPARLLA